MAFAGAGRAEEVDDLGALDEVELGERHDPVTIQRRLKTEVEPLESFRRRQPGGVHGDADAAALPDSELLGEQLIDGFQCRELALLDLLHGMIEGFERARHAQADQVRGDAIQDFGHRPASAARRCPTAP